MSPLSGPRHLKHSSFYPAAGQVSAISWPNEPAGWTTILDYDTGSEIPCTGADCAFGTQGWHAINPNSRVTVFTDTTAPLTPSNALQWTYPTGFLSGAAPATLYHTFSAQTTVYIGFWWKPSNPWQGDASNINKIAFLFAGPGSTGYLSEVEMRGPNGGPYHLDVILEWGFGTSNPGPIQDSYGTDSRFLPHSNNTSNITLGAWHRVEMIYRMSTTTSSADGEVKWWLDGVLESDCTQANSTTGLFNMFEFSPTWGGNSGLTKLQDDYFWYDHIHMSHP